MAPNPATDCVEPGRHLAPRIGLGRILAVMLLHLLDATYELFRAHFGFPGRQAPDGREIGATFGIIETTLSLLREPNVTHMAAATDTVIRSFRNQLFDGYKTEIGMPPELLAQFPLAEEALEALGVVTWKMLEFEADDAIATAAFRFIDEVEQVVVCTPDKDMAQCVIGDDVVLYNRRQRSFMNEEGVIEKFGVAPESIPDYLALVGDTADGVPGLAGWGAKSASAVLGRWRRLEQIPTKAGDWGVAVRSAEKLAETLRANQQTVYLYRTLTTLRRDVPLAENLPDLEWQGVKKEPFLELCDRWGFDDIRSRPHKWQ